MTNDLVSNMLTCIRNASLAKHTFTRVQYSKLNLAILKVFQAEGYIISYYLEKSGKLFDTTKVIPLLSIRVILKYKGWWIKKPMFLTIKRISKPGQRIFAGYRFFPKVINTLKYKQGIAVISTSIGIFSHLKAKKLKLGGEILCYIG